MAESQDAYFVNTVHVKIMHVRTKYRTVARLMKTAAKRTMTPLLLEEFDFFSLKT